MRFFATIIATLVASAPAFAADLPQPAPPPPRAPAMYVPIAPVYNWGGIYGGFNGGYAFGNSDWTGAAVSSGNFSTSGFVIGGTLGFNYQINALVLGAETDLDYTGIKGTGPASFCTNCQTANTWLGTTRARVGFAADRVLFYGTGGVAYGNVRASANGVTNTNTEVGWTGGAGVETAFADNWTVRIEYLYVDLSKGSCTTACGTLGAPPVIPPQPAQSVSFTQSIIRAGIDYKFSF